MFPGGPPGLGLLLLRASLGSTLVAYGMMWMAGERWSFDPNWLLASALIITGVMLLIGFLTPAASTAVCIGGVIGAVQGFFANEASEIFIVFVTFTAASIALLGPGAVSVDARLFGRREIVIPKRTT
jgi:uncharacterized membrane protein YphA (DoxX/SURF4 family)